MRGVIIKGLTLAVVAADPCTQLGQLLNLPDTSYVKNGVCHGLCWLGARGTTEICFHSSATREWCSGANPVLVHEAASRVGGGPLVAASGSVSVLEEAPPVVEVARETSLSRSRDTVIRIAAMGDCGVSDAAFKPTVDVLTGYKPRDATFLLGDLFYPAGLRGKDDGRISAMADKVAGPEGVPIYPVLGNHDHLGDPAAVIEYSARDARWRMRGFYYFEKFTKEGISVCAWFLDTDGRRFDATQQTWLRESLRIHQMDCTWRVVSGHHFMYSAGEYHNNDHLIRFLYPILGEFNVHLYLSGHEHNSQVIKAPDHPTWQTIAGALGDMRNKPDRGNENLVYLNKKDVSFLNLEFSESSIHIEFVKTYKPNQGQILFATDISM